MNKNVKMALIIGGAILAVLIVFHLVFGLIWGGQYGGWGMMGLGMMGGCGWMWLMPFFGIFFLGLIIWTVVASLRSSSESGGQDLLKSDSALEVLKKRYARGDISKEEYEEKKKDLG